MANSNAIFNINDFDSDVRPILLGAKTAQNMYRKNSVSALAKDLILEYPVLLSADIDYETAVVISKALELQFAALQVLVLSADTAFGVDPMKNAGLRDLLSKYHSNSDTPDLVNYAGNLMFNAGQTVGKILESAEDDSQTTFKITKVTQVSKGLPKEAIDSMWDRSCEEVEASTLNDLYCPAKALVKTVESVANAAVAKAAKANEDAEDALDYLQSTLVDKQNGPSTFDARKLGKADGKFIVNPYSSKDAPSGARIMKIEKDFTKLEPTMLEFEFFVHDGKDSARIQKAVFGVATMPRAIPSDVMRSNIIKSFQYTHTGFKFIQYTRGERKLVKDFIFNVTNIKEDALAKTKYDKWFAALRKRKNNARAFKGGNATINPLTTLVITKNDAAMIKQASNFDLTDEGTAMKLMDSLYLLCFVIVDTDTGLVSTILDGQKYFVETTVDALKKGNSNKNNDIANVREILKLLGR